jgi:aminoglycoside N3'-acetyltransferase
MRLSAESTPSYIQKVVKGAPKSFQESAELVDFIYVDCRGKSQRDFITKMKKLGIELPAKCFVHTNVRENGKLVRVPTKNLLCDGATIAIFSTLKKDTNGNALMTPPLKYDADGNPIRDKKKRHYIREKKLQVVGVSYRSIKEVEPAFDYRKGRVKAVANAVQQLVHAQAKLRSERASYAARARVAKMKDLSAK